MSAPSENLELSGSRSASQLALLRGPARLDAQTGA